MNHDSVSHQKTLVYIVLAIVVVILLAGYIYMLLSRTSSTQSPQTVTQGNRVTLTPAQLAERETLLQSLANEKPINLTPAQIASRKATLQDLASQKPTPLTPAQLAERAAVLQKLQAEQ